MTARAERRFADALARMRRDTTQALRRSTVASAPAPPGAPPTGPVMASGALTPTSTSADVVWGPFADGDLPMPGLTASVLLTLTVAVMQVSGLENLELRARAAPDDGAWQYSTPMLLSLDAATLSTGSVAMQVMFAATFRNGLLFGADWLGETGGLDEAVLAADWSVVAIPAS